MYYLYGYKAEGPPKLVATFASEQQLLAYTRWATLSENEGICKFEQGSSLASYRRWSSSREPITQDDPATVDHNPSPSML
jgi:hypothetical protein